MAALTSPRLVDVRAPAVGEGARIAELWRELWESHEGWGGYAASRDPGVYEEVAGRLDADAAVRGGQSVLGHHVHLVALVHGEVVGQVEGWFDRLGTLPSTPFTCEVRSLVVLPSARHLGVGRSLLEALSRTARDLGRGSRTILAAEVLEQNPALTFYERLGYVPIARTLAMATAGGPAARSAFTARVARDDDALAIALLEGALAHRRRQQGDMRFDPPRAVDASLVSAIAAHLVREGATGDTVEVVVADARGRVHGSATLAIAPLDSPFVPAKRAVMGRFALDPAVAPHGLVPPLLALGCRTALARGIPTLELTDLPEPGTPIYEAFREAGGRPWSRIISRSASRV